MYSKIIINILFIIGLTAFQLAFISGLPVWINSLNLILVILVFILTLGNLKLALWWAIGVGFLLDIYSFLPFGAYLISLFITLILTNFLLSKFFTNKSLYSFFVLTAFATIFYDFFLFQKIELSNIVLNLITVFVIFYLISFASNKLKPVFLVKRK